MITLPTASVRTFALLFWSCVGIGIAPAPATSQPCGGQTPCFESNPDLLSGERDALPVDDVVFLNGTAASKNAFARIVEIDALQPNVNVNLNPSLGAVNCKPSLTAADPRQLRMGRVWPLSRDNVVTLLPTPAATGSDCSTASGNNLELIVTYRGLGQFDSTTAFRATASWAEIALGDVDYDGLDEVVFINGTEIVIFDAVVPGDALTGDIGNPSAGLEVVGQLALGAGMTPLAEPFVTDLNADGARELVWLGADPTVGSQIDIRIASICPTEGAVLDLPQGAHTCSKAFETVLASTAIATGFPIRSVSGALAPAVAVAGGNLDGSSALGDGTPPDEEIVFVGNQLTAGDDNVRAYAFALDPSLKAAAPKTLLVHESGSLDLYLDVGPLDGDSSAEQAVVGYKQNIPSQTGPVSAIDVVSFDQDLAMEAFHWTPPEAQYNSFGGTTIGRFDPPTDSEGNVTFDRQIAMLTPALGFTGVNVFVVHPPDFTPILRGAVGGTVIWPGEVLDGSAPRAGDSAGRSMQLGEPTVARISNHSQPSVVLGDPPKHVDYIPPTLGANPEIVNFTAIRSFSSQFDLAETSTTSSATTTSSSHSWSWTASSTEKFSVKVPLVSRISGSFTQAWSRSGESANATINSQYVSRSIQDTAQTQATDFINGTSQNFNVYVYPVVGQKICPNTIEEQGAELLCEQNGGGGCTCSPDGSATSCSGIANDPAVTTCTANGQCCNTPNGPLNVQVSSPDTIVEFAYGANAPGKAEWYQPVHEPLNLLSYPWTFEQLGTDVPTKLTRLSDQIAFDTDSTPNLLSVSWTAGGSTGSSVGSTSTHSFQTDNSIQVGTPEVEKLTTGAGASVSGSFSYGSSSSSSSLNNKQSALSESFGAVVSKPGFANSNVSLYSYGFDPVLFVQTPSPGVIQTLSGTCGSDGSSTCDLPVGGGAAGALRLMHTVDVTNAGTWWETGPYSPGNGLPDVALNHPSRWSFTISGSGSACVTARVVGSLSNATETDCVDPIPPIAQSQLPTGLWSSEWHFVRGFFTTVDDPNGPLRTTAIDGDQVYLTARVYNYSQKAMDPSAAVRVQFYRQEIDPETYAWIGDSTLVGEDTLGPIPPHNNPVENPQDLPNWSNARVTLDTTDLAPTARTYWLFWIVAWAEVGGAIAPEVAHHGLDLTAPPGTPFSSIADVPPQFVTVTDASGDSVQTSFTNNFGFFHLSFSVLPPGTAEAMPPRSVSPELVIAALRAVERDAAAGGAPLLLEAEIVSPGGDTNGAIVRFFEVERGGAAEIRNLIDEEVLGHLEADRFHLVQIPYRPACGKPREVEIVVAEGNRTEARRTLIHRRQCEPARVCHRGRTLALAEAALGAHLKHGDEIGACRD